MKEQINNTTQTFVKQNRSDKAVQCSKSNEYLQISPDVLFTSRSSLVLNVDSENTKARRNRYFHSSECKLRPQTTELTAPSLEYIANYKPKFCDGDKQNFPYLRSFSTSAIFVLQKRTPKPRCTSSIPRNRNNVRNYNKVSNFTLNATKISIIKCMHHYKLQVLQFRFFPFSNFPLLFNKL
jgi:hypothetical protein